MRCASIAWATPSTRWRRRTDDAPRRARGDWPHGARGLPPLRRPDRAPAPGPLGPAGGAGHPYAREAPPPAAPAPPVVRRPALLGPRAGSRGGGRDGGRGHVRGREPRLGAVPAGTDRARGVPPGLGRGATGTARGGAGGDGRRAA